MYNSLKYLFIWLTWNKIKINFICTTFQIEEVLFFKFYSDIKYIGLYYLKLI